MCVLYFRLVYTERHSSEMFFFHNFFVDSFKALQMRLCVCMCSIAFRFLFAFAFEQIGQCLCFSNASIDGGWVGGCGCVFKWLSVIIASLNTQIHQPINKPILFIQSKYLTNLNCICNIRLLNRIGILQNAIPKQQLTNARV